MLISHLTSLPLLLLLLAQTALTSPTPPPPTSFLRLRPRLVESTPWQLHDLRIFTAQPGTPGISYISFTFADSNAASISPPPARATCRKARLAVVARSPMGRCFRHARMRLWGGRSMGRGLRCRGFTGMPGMCFAMRACVRAYFLATMRRWCRNTDGYGGSVGSPPWDRVTAFGEVVVANLTTATTTTTSKSTCGTLVMSKVLKVPVTRLVSKRK